MKKAVLSAIVLTGVVSASALVHLPAQFVVQYAPMPSQLKVIGVEGTVWQGSAYQVEWAGQKLGELNWQLHPSKLLTATLEANVRFGRGSDMDVQGRGILGYSLGGAYAKNLIASVPVESVMKVAPSLPVPLELDGQIEVSLRDYQYAAPYCQSAEGSVVWNTETIGSPLAHLTVGPIVAQLQCQDSQIDITADQQSKQVTSEAKVSLSADGRYSATAWFKPEGDFPNELSQQLKWLPNQADQEGKYPFSYNGRL